MQRCSHFVRNCLLVNDFHMKLLFNADSPALVDLSTASDPVSFLSDNHRKISRSFLNHRQSSKNIRVHNVVQPKPTVRAVAAATVQSKPTTTANQYSTSIKSSIEPHQQRRKLPTKPAELLLDRWQHPRPTSSISAELVVAGTTANRQPRRHPIPTAFIPSIVTGLQLSSFFAPANAAECYESFPAGTNSPTTANGRYTSEPVDFRHGECGSDDVAGPAATADSISAGCFAAATNAGTADIPAELSSTAAAAASSD